jgi:hypothetical protein
MATNKKKSTVVKKPALKSVKKPVAKKTSSSLKQKSVTSKSAPKKSAPAKNSSAPTQDKLTKDALKLVDKASSLLRKGIKTGSKATHEARTALHQEAHSLLGQASTNLDHALKSGASFLRKAISKI